MVGVWIDVGSCFEIEKNNGVGYFLEYLVFKGIKNWFGSVLEKEVESMGVYFNVYSIWEYIVYYIKVLFKDLLKVVEFLGDIV